jgi:hypothetical protein
MHNTTSTNTHGNSSSAIIGISCTLGAIIFLICIYCVCFYKARKDKDLLEQNPLAHALYVYMHLSLSNFKNGEGQQYLRAISALSSSLKTKGLDADKLEDEHFDILVEDLAESISAHIELRPINFEGTVLLEKYSLSADTLIKNHDIIVTEVVAAFLMHLKDELKSVEGAPLAKV